jgi:hypothetical protein
MNPSAMRSANVSLAHHDDQGHADESIQGGAMTGSRGYVCSDGPLAGTVLMLNEDAETGSLWSVADAGGVSCVYQFVVNHFEHAPADLTPEGAATSGAP